MEEHTKLFWSKKKLLLAVGLVLLAGVCLFLFMQNSRRLDIEISAPLVDETHIGLDGIFTVTGAGDMDLDELAGRLTFQTPMEFRLQPRQEEGALTLQTYLPLEAGQRVIISLLEANGKTQKQWEFQTMETFHVMGVFPADGATLVPPNTSVEMALSYKDIDVENVGKYITLSPMPESGINFFQRNNVIVMTINAELEPEAAYEVTISGDLPRINGETLGQEYRFSFKTGVDSGYNYHFSSRIRLTENVLPGEEVLLKLDVGNELASKSFSTTVYRYGSADGYLNALRSYRDKLIGESYGENLWRGEPENWQVDTDGLAEVMQFTGPLVSVSTFNNTCVLLPDTLEPGWYAATVESTLPSGESTKVSKLIQVNSLSVYYAQPKRLEPDRTNQLVAWVNDTQTGQPVNSANVSVTASNYAVDGKTGSDGIAVLEGAIAFVKRYGENWGDENNPYAEVVGVLAVKDGSNTFYDIYGDSYEYAFNLSDAPNRYLSYLFTDRPVYRHTDKVKVWGLIKARQEGTPLPEGLHLTIADNTVNVPITPSADGTFQTEINVEALADDYAWLEIADGKDNRYTMLWLKIEDYVKPVYQTSASPDKLVYTAWADKDVKLAFTASYFEGTPAQQYRAVARRPEDYSYTEEAYSLPEVSLATDAEGKAQAVLQPKENKITEWRPQQIHYGIYSQQELGAPQVQGGTFYYLFRDVMLTLKKGSDGQSLTAYTNRIDTSRIKQEADLLVDDNLKGAAVDVQLEAKVHKVYYQKVPNGERYDIVNKTSVTAYEYNYTDDVIDTITAASVGGSYTFTGLPNDDDSATYYLEVTATDSRGLPMTETLYYSETTWEVWSDGSHRFQLLKREPEDAQKIYGDYGYSQPFVDGENLDVYLTDFGEEVSDAQAKMLYLVAQDTILDYGSIAGTDFQLPYSERYLPNYVLLGAYFDGKHVYATSYSEMIYSPEKRELDIAIAPSQETYDPGDQADITFRVTEKETGKPVANTQVVAAVVDEAVFAIQEQVPELLNKLYRHIPFGTMLQYTSYDNHPVDGGGRGGGGPENFVPRTDFQDTAAFQVLTTGADGTAALDVPLPDNLTAWRVTALALSPELKAGDTKNSFTVSKDFFITPVLPPRLLTGDDLVITAYSAGRAIKPEDVVNYTCAIDGVQGTITAAGKACDFTPMTINKLPLGDYKITVTGKWNGKQDSVALPLQVVESGVNVSVSRDMPLTEAASIQSTSYPVVLGFYDKANALSAEILSYLARYQGARADQRIARRFAMEQMRSSGIDQSSLDAAALSDKFEDLCPDYRYYRLFPYSEESGPLTARIQLAVPPEYYQGSLTYDLGELSGVSDPAERAAGYLLISEYKQYQSTVDEIARQLESSVYSFQDKMYLVAALARAGDMDRAKSWYKKITEPVSVQQTDAGGNRLLSMSSADNTAAACLAATMLQLDEAEALVRALLSTPSADNLYLLELLYYLRQQAAPSAQNAQLTYTWNGADQTLNLAQGVIYRSFSKEQLAKARFRPSGTVWTNVLYTAGIDQAMERDNQKLQLTKTIEAAGGGALRQGDLARITLRLLVPAGVSLDPEAALTLEDYVPTGMRYESIQTETGWSLSTQNDQRLAFAGFLDKSHTLTYFARCVAPGSYVGESAFISTSTGSVWGASNRQILAIQPRENQTE